MFELMEPATESVDDTPVPKSWVHYQLFTELKAYLDEHGYPSLIRHQIHTDAPRYLEGAPPTKSNINHSTYRFGVNRLLDQLPVDDAISEDLERQKSLLGQKVEVLVEQIKEQQNTISEYQGLINKIEADYESLVVGGDEGAADKADDDLFRHQRKIKRAEILLKGYQNAIKKLEPYVLCMDCLLDGCKRRLNRRKAEQAKEIFIQQIGVFKEHLDNFTEIANQSADMRLREHDTGKLILKHLGL